MPSNNNRINFQVGYNVDQASVNAVKKSLQDLQNIKIKDFSGSKKQLEEIKDTARQVEKALDEAFNVNLGSLNVKSFNDQLKTAGLSVNQIYSQFSKAGVTGTNAFRNMASSVLTTNLQLKQTKSLLSSMGETMVNTVKWGIASSVMNNFTNSVQQAFQYAKSLDSALTDIRIVTSDSTEQMRQFAKEANNTAQNLGRSTMDYTKAALTFYQQGLSEQDVQTRTQSVLKAQNITGAGQEMADYLTAVWNGYKVANEEAELYVDKLAAVADSSASNMSELAIAMSKVASTANTMGVDVDQLNAQIATIVATTRQAPESVGNALKTVYTRINDIATGSEDAQISLGNYSSKMAEVGINVLDTNGKLRDTGEVFEEIGSKWESFSREQQIYLARTMAGQRQINNMTALFDNWDKYIDLVNISLDAQGTTMQKNAIYMESLGAKLEQLGAASQRVKDALINEEDLKGLTQLGTGIVNLFGSFIESIGGGRRALLGLTGVITSLFGPAISKQLGSIINNFQQAKYNAQSLKQQIQNTRDLGLSKGYSDEIIKEMVDSKKQIQQYYSTMSAAQIESYDNIVREIGAHQNLRDKIKEEQNQLEKFNNSVAQAGQIKFGNNFETQVQVALQVTKDLGNELKNLSLSDLKDKQVFNELVRQVKELEETVGQEAVPAFDHFEKILKQIESDGGPGATDKLAQLRAMARAALNQTNNLLGKDIDQIKAKAIEAESNLNKLRQARDQALSQAKNNTFSQNLTAYISSLTQIMSIINNIHRLSQVWQDDSLSQGEKIRQTITNVLFSAGMLINSLSQISKAMGIQNLLADKRFLKQHKIRLEKELQNAENLKAIAYQKALSSEIAGGSDAADTLLTYQKTRENVKNLRLELDATKTALNGTQSVGTLVFSKISSGVSGLIGFLTGPAGLVLAIGAVAVAIGYTLYKAYNKAADAAKEAAEKAEQAKESYDNTINSIKDLNSSLDNLKSARDNLNDLTKGTLQWNSALQDVNSQVLDLIKKYPQLKVYSDDNGILNINQDSLNDYLQKSQQYANIQGLAYASLNRESIEAQNKSLIVDYSRNVDDFLDIPLGITAEEVQAVVDAINKHGSYILESKESLKKYTDYELKNIDALFQNRKGLDDLATVVKNNIVAAEDLSSALSKSAAMGTKQYQDTSNKDVYLAIYNQRVKNAKLNDQEYMITPTEEDYSRVSYYGGGFANTLPKFDKNKLFNEWKEVANNEVQLVGDVFQELVEGEWKSIPIEDVKQIVAQSKIARDEGILQSIKQTADSFKEEDSKIIAAVIDGINESNKTGISSHDLQRLIVDLNAGPQQGDLIQQVAELIGVDSNQLNEQLITLRKEINAAKQEYVRQQIDVYQSLKKSFSNLIDPQKYGDLSIEGLQNLGTSLQKIFEQSGRDGLNAFEEILKSASQQDSKLISQIFSNANLQTPEGLKELEESLKNIGDGSIVASQGWEFLKQSIQDSFFINPLDQVFDEQAKINDIAKGIKKYSIINQEDYNSLIQINSQIESMFKRVAGGYQFIGQKGSLMELLTGGSNGYIKAANEFDKVKNAAEELANSFGEDFKASAVESLGGTVLSTINQIQSSDASEKLWAALGFNKDNLLEIDQRFQELRNKERSEGLTDQQAEEYERLTQVLQTFLNKASTVDEVVTGISDSLRTAAALGAQSFSELNDLLVRGQISTQDYANSIQKVSQAEAQSYGIDTEKYEEYLKLLMATNEQLKNNEALARQVAIENLRVSEGIESLIDNWEDYNDAIKDYLALDRDISAIADQWEDLSQTLANLLNVDQGSIDLLGPDFVADNWDKIQQVKDGVQGAYQDLQNLTQDRVLEIAMQAAGTDEAKAEIQTAFDYINQMSNQIPDFTIMARTVGLEEAENGINDLTSAALDMGALSQQGADAMIASLQTIVDNMGLYGNQAQELAKLFGYDVQLEEKPGENVSTPTQTQYYVPPFYGFETIGEASFGILGKFPVRLPKLIRGGYFQSTPAGTATDYAPGAYAIKSITKNGSSGGNITKRHASAPSRSSGRSSGGGRGGGGGRGSSPKTATPKQPTQVKPQTLSEAKNSIDDRSDVYHDINLALEKQEDKLDDIQNKQKKLVNKDRLKNLQQQNKQLEKQKDLLDQKSGIAASELVRLRNEIVKDLGDGIKFDKNGQIANYNAALDKARDNYNSSIADYNKKVLDAENAYNKYVDQYNSMSGDAQEANKKELEHQKDLMEAAKKSAQKSLNLEKDKYDVIKDNVKEYEDTLKLQRDIANEQQEIQDKIYENLIAMSKIKVDLSIDTGDFERDWLDFENKFIKKLDKDDFLGSAKASAKELMSYFNSDQVQQTASEIDKIRKEIAIMQAGGPSSIYSVVDKDGNIVAQNLAQAQEDLEDYMKQQMDDLADVQDLVDDIKDNYLDALDNAKDKMDDQIDQYERVNDLIDHNVKLTQMLYGDTAYNTMNKYYELQKANNKNQLESLRMQQQYWQNLFNGIQRDKDGRIINQQEYDNIKKNLDDVTDNLNSKLEEMIENLSDQWQNRVDGIIAKLNNALTGGRGLDYLDEQWDYINTFDDNFLDTFESNMGIQEVTDLYKQAIDGLSGSPVNQQKINKLMNEQLKILREKDNLTQYDIDRAKAALEVEKARMALEDARYNKTKMRLRRDSQGNYTYQYVADEEKLGDLQAALADAQANLYNMDKEHYTQNLNTLYDAYKDYIDKMRDLTEEYNNTQDAEERARIQARIDLLRQSTNNLMQGLTEDNKYALQYLNESFFGGMGIDTTLLSADEQIEIMTQNIPQMQSNIQDLANTLVGEGGILNATNDAMKQISDATVEYDKNVKQFLTDAGSSLQVVTNVTDAAGNALDKNIQQAESLITTNQKLIDECNAQVDAIQKLLSWLDQYMNKVMNVQTLVANLRSAYGTGQQLNGSNLTADNIAVESMGLDTTTGMNFTGNPKTDAAAVKQEIDRLMAQYEQFLTQMSIATFDTGGSTGSWGDAEGRLAFLHEKELVLNQQDTANILAAVEAVRMITGSLNGLATGEIGSLINNATGLLGGIDNTNTLDQNVHIEANFPNVTQHTEIEQAFNNLVNMASMRASGYRD